MDSPEKSRPVIQATHRSGGLATLQHFHTETDLNSLLKSERMVRKEIREIRGDDEANNVQAVVSANKDKMRTGQYVGRCLAPKLPFPHDLMNEERYLKGFKQQKTIPKMY